MHLLHFSKKPSYRGSGRALSCLALFMARLQSGANWGRDHAEFGTPAVTLYMKHSNVNTKLATFNIVDLLKKDLSVVQMSMT
jgi:hypothetical protein